MGGKKKSASVSLGIRAQFSALNVDEQATFMDWCQETYTGGVAPQDFFHGPITSVWVRRNAKPAVRCEASLTVSGKLSIEVPEDWKPGRLYVTKWHGLRQNLIVKYGRHFLVSIKCPARWLNDETPEPKPFDPSCPFNGWRAPSRELSELNHLLAEAHPDRGGCPERFKQLVEERNHAKRWMEQYAKR